MIAMAMGGSPTPIGGPALLVAVLIGLTASKPLLTTYAVFPLAVIASAHG